MQAQADVHYSGLRVLVVEDDYFIALELCTALRDAGADVIGPARDLESGLAAITRAHRLRRARYQSAGPHGLPGRRGAARARHPVDLRHGLRPTTIPAELADLPRLEKPVDLVGSVPRSRVECLGDASGAWPEGNRSMSIAANTSRLLQRLASLAPLAAEESLALEDAAGPARLHRPHEELAREGETPTHVKLIVSGFACRCRVLPDGRRQIISYLIPGDLCDAGAHLLIPVATHTVSTLTAANVAPFNRETLIGLIERYPRIGQALCCLALIEELIAREWLVNVGQRTAIERLAHLLCEIFARMRRWD